MAKNIAFITLPSNVLHLVSLLVGLKKAREEAAGAKTESGAIHAAAKLAKSEHKALAKFCEERQHDIKAWKATTSQSKATLAK